jgi:FKBP-type peptidyl-prolyl cis-trans isomerase
LTVIGNAAQQTGLLYKYKTMNVKNIFIFCSAYMILSCSCQQKLSGSVSVDGYIITESGLKYKILKNGKGKKVKVGQEVLIRETTTYLNGTVLYSNESSNTPVKVLIGGNQATNAVDEGLRGMREGEVRQLIAPSNLVKRKSYPPNVSPDSSLAIKIILDKIL